jgi:hypothetical protein
VELRWVLLPLFVQVGLTLFLATWMGLMRVRDIRLHGVKPADIALREPGWTKKATQVANAFHNQLELPVLFYVLVILAWVTRHADLLFVIMAWAFVMLRIAHAYIHVTDNRVRRRGAAFALGAIVLQLMWLIFIVRILLGLG